MSALTEAIVAHKAAWQAFQDAPSDEKHRDTIGAMDAEATALFDLLRVVPENKADLLALKKHLDWWVIEEAQRRDFEPEPFALHASITHAMWFDRYAAGPGVLEIPAGGFVEGKRRSL